MFRIESLFFFSLFIIDILFFNHIIKLIEFINFIQFNDQDLIFFLKKYLHVLIFFSQ